MRTLTYPSLTSSETTYSLTVPAPNWSAEYREKRRKTNEVFLTQLTAPTNKPVTVRVQITTVNNIYDGYGDIKAANRAIDPRGIKILVESFATGVVADPDHPEIPEVHLPIKDQRTITLAIGDDTITATKILAYLTSSTGMLFDAVSSTNRLDELLRECKVPRGVNP